MRVTFNFVSDRDIILKPNYQLLIQGLIYKYLDKDFARFLHDHGYFQEGSKRIFKMFTFSYIKSSRSARYLNHIGAINFSKEISFSVSTVIEELAISLIENQMRDDQIRLGDNILELSGIKVHTPVKFSVPQKICMYSPMTVYSTDDKKTYYYNPFDSMFNEQIYNNLLRKYQAYKNNEQKNLSFSIKPLFTSLNNGNKIITRYKNFIIEAYLGNYEIESSSELIQFSYDVGLGSKNSQGFGLWDVWRER